jgi:hypothetical protein
VRAKGLTEFGASSHSLPYHFHSHSLRRRHQEEGPGYCRERIVTTTRDTSGWDHCEQQALPNGGSCSVRNRSTTMEILLNQWVECSVLQTANSRPARQR